MSILRILTLLSFALLLATLAIQGRAQGQPDAPPASAARHLLRWKFTKDDVIRYEFKAVEHLVLEGRHRYRNERTHIVRWTVRSVDKEGNAEIAVVFERVMLDLEVPQLRFDSSHDIAGKEPTDPVLKSEFYQARSLAYSEFACRVDPRGGIANFVGAEAAELSGAPIQFTPGDWPELPTNPVRAGDVWKSPVGFTNPLMGSKAGEAVHTVRAEKKSAGHVVLEIDCTSTWTSKSGLMAGFKSEPTKQLAEFDPVAGRYLTRRVYSVGTGRTGGDQPFELKIDSTSRILPASEPMAWQPPTGSHLLKVADGQEIFILCHSGWTDKNKNGQPDPDEFQEIKSRYWEDEKIGFIATISGLKDRKLRYDGVDARGNKLFSNDIPLKHETMFATREISVTDAVGKPSALPAGMYFLEWYLDNRLIHFTPLQVIGGKRAEIAPLDEPTGVLKSASEYVDRGRAWQHQREFEHAVADFTEAIRLEPQNDTAFMLRAGVYYLMRNYSRARADADESIRLKANNPAGFAMRAMIRMRSGDLKAAHSDATEAIRLAPRFMDAYLTRGEILGRMRKFDEALADFDAAIGLDPRNPELFRNRGKTWLAKLEFDKCIADETEAIRLDPNDAEAYYRRGQARQLKGDLDKAVHDFDQAITRNSAEPAFYLTRGTVLAQRGVHDRALADLEAVLRLDPKNVQAYHLRGDLRAAQGDFDQSIADHAEVIRLNPADVDAWVHRGIAYVSNRELDKGIADLTEALRLKPDHYVALCVRGDAWISKEQYNKSMDDHTAAIAANPKLASAYHHRGATLSTIGKYREATEDFQEAIRLDPKVPWFHIAYSLILSASPEAKFRDGKRAVALATTAGDLLAWKRPEAWMALAAAHAETGDFEAAVRAQTEALELKPGDQDLQTQLDLYRQHKPFRETPRPDKPAPRRER